MAENLRTSVILDLKGNLEQRARRYGNAMSTMSRRGNRSLSSLNAGFKKHNSIITGISRRYGALAIAAGVAVAGKKVLSGDARLAQLQADSQVSAEKIEELKQKFFDLAQDPDIRLGMDDLLPGVEDFVALTGDFPFILKNLREMGLLIRATGAAAGDVGSIFSIVYKGNIRETEKLTAVTEKLLAQSLAGSVSFRDEARIGRKFTGPAFAKLGSNAETLTDVFAVAQIIADAVGTVDEAAEASKSLLSALLKTDVQKTLKEQAGINVLNEDGMLRRFPVLIDEIYTASDGKFGLLGEEFGESAVRVFEGFSIPGNKKKLFELMNISSDGGLVLKNARINASTAQASAGRIGSAVNEGADFFLSPLTKGLAESLDNIESGRKTILQELSDRNVQGGQAIIDSLRGVFREEFKATVEIKVDGPAAVKKVSKSGHNKNFNVEVDTGRTMVGQ